MQIDVPSDAALDLLRDLMAQAESGMMLHAAHVSPAGEFIEAGLAAARRPRAWDKTASYAGWNCIGRLALVDRAQRVRVPLDEITTGWPAESRPGSCRASPPDVWRYLRSPHSWSWR